MKDTLYPWQEECLQAWSETQYHGIVNVVTGAGKTIMALAGMERLDKDPALPLRVKIIVPKTFMVFQWAASMSGSLSISRDEIGYYYGSQKDSPRRKYTLYVINSARYSLSRHIMEDIRMGYSVLVIADECHHYASPENRKIFDFLPLLADNRSRYFSMGLSATPQTEGYESVLIPSLGPEIFRYHFEDAIEQHTIRNFAVFHIALSFCGEERSEYDEMSDKLTIAMGRLTSSCPYLNKLEKNRFFAALKHLAANSPSPVIASNAQVVLTLSYQRKSLLYSAASRIDCVCTLIDNLPPQSKIIIFGERIEQADLLFDRLNQQYPNQIGRYHSKLEPLPQKNTIARYHTGEIRILVCCRALDEGFDIPATHIGILLSSASLERQRIQRLGRILRQSADSDIASLYYLYIRDTAEEEAFFSDKIPHSHSLSLSYSTEDKKLSHPAYKEAAEKILLYFKQQGLSDSLLSEMEKCLKKGSVLPDWLLDSKLCEEKVAQAGTTEIRNYWICMLQMARAVTQILPTGTY